jgi:hypothetical protein
MLEAVMTREEAIAKLKDYQDERGDIEIQHSLADDVLCDLLRHLGYGDVVDEYDKVPKWFA